jgi:hypothetical protein
VGAIIAIGVVVIGYVVLSRSGGLNLSGGLTARTSPPITGSYPYNQPPISPSQTTNPFFGSTVNAGAGVATAAVAQSASAGNFPGGGGAALGAVAGIAVIGAIASSLLAAHEARLKGATNENNAALQTVPAFDSFLQSIVQAVNVRQIDKPTAAATVASFDQALYQRLKSLVGAPGTAWVDNPAGQCNKSCTVSCCIYWADMKPALDLVRYVLGDRQVIFGAGDPRLSGNTVTVPKVFPGKYSSYTRPSYTLTIV